MMMVAAVEEWKRQEGRIQPVLKVTHNTVMVVVVVMVGVAVEGKVEGTGKRHSVCIFCIGDCTQFGDSDSGGGVAVVKG